MPLAFQEHGQVDSAPGEAASRNRLPREDSFPPRATDLVQSAKWPNPLEARETVLAAAGSVQWRGYSFLPLHQIYRGSRSRAPKCRKRAPFLRSEEHTSELQSRFD